MSKITICSPCHNIHRIVLPPDSERLIYHEFPSGAIVKAKILLALTDGAKDRMWDEEIRGMRKTFPDRFIQISQFDPTPLQKKHLVPKTKYFRIRRKEDGEDFNKYTYTSPLRIVNNGKRSILVVGGRAQQKLAAADIGNNGRPSTDADCPVAFLWGSEKHDICYLISKEFDEAVAHAESARKAQTAMTLIAQMDLGHLAKIFPIQSDTSYDRTVGDICRAKRGDIKAGQNGGELRLLDYVGERSVGGWFDYLIVRIGNAANLIIAAPERGVSLEKQVQASKHTITLCYHPDRCAPTRSPSLGDMLSYDLLLTVCMVYSLNQFALDDVEQAVVVGAKAGVHAAYECFLKGFGTLQGKRKIVPDDLKERGVAEVLLLDFAREALKRQGFRIGNGENGYGGKVGAAERREVAPMRICRVDYDEAASPNVFWRMAFPFKEVKGTGDKESKRTTREEECILMGRNYLCGNEAKFPIVEIGVLRLVDRHEVEDYLFLQNLLLDYHADTERRRPLSVGVFGQPGAGKSFGVKQLVSEMSGDGSAFARESITLNLSQIRSVGELADAFHRIRDACLSGPIPLVFFDEFDSGFEGKAFGWLKYFLAPMQDGEFVENGKLYHFGKAIFVFAGGVNHSFAEFNERSRNPEFCDSKGPDFISRLRGILNIKSMNKPEGEAFESIYILRRAVFIRYKLEKILGELNDRLIAPRLGEALLTVDRFKHGVRSLEAILDMSRLKPGETFNAGDLPPRDQLDMHVDARAFLARAGVVAAKAKSRFWESGAT